MNGNDLKVDILGELEALVEGCVVEEEDGLLHGSYHDITWLIDGEPILVVDQVSRALEQAYMGYITEQIEAAYRKGIKDHEEHLAEEEAWWREGN